MIDGCDKNFHPYITAELLQLIFQATKHTNRCVREIGFRTLGVLIRSELGSNGILIMFHSNFIFLAIYNLV